ncbi:ABC transporter ATP-binding protein [Alicyclobacillus sendaiensis]|uniref:ABC transporter ATP-binding protein n=1 Tax=Alicyclobacillus sendaiensis TaxID=192387 RepID=UPI0026F459BD|nr:ABC transporter ATP-binding protein [Alicyclobacillus sendaiensis]
MNVLQLFDVSKRIGSREIVHQLNMTVRAGEVYGFLGPNGAGKTTTIRMIVGLIRPTRGAIHVLGHDVEREPVAAKRYLGAIVENPEMYGYLTGRQNLLHFARLAGLDGPSARARVEYVAERVGLKARLDDKVKRYSLGMRQRLGVAQALLGDPKLLVLDEPPNGLDPAGIREFRELVRSLAAEGMAVFVSSHLLSEVEQMCDRVAVLQNGSVIAEAKVDELRSQSGSVRLRVSRPNEAVLWLQAHGYDVDASGDGLTLAHLDDAQVARTLRHLMDAGFEIYEAARTGGLEQSFLALTGAGSGGDQA